MRETAHDPHSINRKLMEAMKVNPVSFEKVLIKEGFWADRIKIVCEKTIWVCINECERTHRIDNFRRAGGMQPGGFTGTYFDDSDVYKVLEGAAYVLSQCDAPKLEEKTDEIIEAICSAQQPDGYLYTYFILNTPDKRWTDMNYHEAYCLGHMLEGAIAYARATGKEKWLKAAKRALEQMMSVNGPEGQHWITGHEELELALVKLYRYTGETRYLEYARWLVEERGHGHLKTPLSPEIDFFHPEYCQDDLPVRELTRVTGHAVRAMYYYSGVTDLSVLLGDDGYETAMKRVWENVIPANMYITGGIGQSASNEGFTRDWSLPNLTAYCETCASIGMAMWNRRMNCLHGDRKYADIVELELYNGILSGISLDGERFFYENPLASVGRHHRRQWYGCSCCPTNLVRFIPSIGDYAYSVDEDTVIINQFICSEAQCGELKLAIETDYPWNGEIHIRVFDFEGTQKLKIRIPGWCRKYTLKRESIPCGTESDGYMEVEVRDGDELEYSLDMPVRRIQADPRIAEDAGRTAVMRGPIVYCAEEIDNPGILTEYFHAEKTLPCGEELIALKEQNLLSGIVTVTGESVKLIPYYAWDNRTAGAMAVWLKEV